MYLIDTNVISEMRKVLVGKADARVVRWMESVDPVQMFISVITMQELMLGIQLVARRDAQQGELLNRWLAQVQRVFAGRILDVDIKVVTVSAQLHVPNQRPFSDGLIAATALVHNMTVVTRNIADFSPMGVKLINPWEFQ